MTVTCPEVEPAEVTVKYNAASQSQVGTIVLSTGGAGMSLYEDDQIYGPDLIEELNDAGFATVQVGWETPWNSGPGGLGRLGCRYATLAQWIYDELHDGGQEAPFCASGNSGGTSQVAYALTRFGFDGVLDAAVLSSGPPHARIDLGCDCSPGIDAADVPCADDSLCYSTGNIVAIDEAYVGTPCRDGCTDVLAADSIVAPGVDYDYPTTRVIALFGGQDNSNAVAQAVQWYEAITSEVEISCVPEATHAFASSIEGFEAVRDALITECRIQE